MNEKKLYAVDTDGNAYAIDVIESVDKALDQAYRRGLKLCIVTDGVSMISARFDSWTAPAWVHAIQPNAQIGRTVQDTVATIQAAIDK